MTAPGPDLVRAVRAGCSQTFPDCAFPSESCNRYCAGAVRQLRAALAELAKPSAEMVRAGRAEIKPDNLPADDGDARQCWRAMMRKVLGDGNV